MPESTVVTDPPAPPTPPAPPAPAAPVEPPVEVWPETVAAASFEALMAKARRTGEAKVPDPAGGSLLVKFVAIGYDAYDELVAACPPKARDIEVGGNFELEKFGPRLLAACLTQPALTVDEATKLWHNPNWAGGEIVDLFSRVRDLCQRGLNVPFIAAG